MGIFDIFSSKPVQSEGIPVRNDSLVNDIPKSQRDAAVSLFQRLIQEYYPNSEGFGMEHYKSPRCSFDDMRKFFDANAPGNFPDEATIPGRMQAELLDKLPHFIENREREAFTQLESVLQKFAQRGFNENEIPKLIHNYERSPRSIEKQFPEIPRLINEYKVARNIYNAAVNDWALGVMKGQPENESASVLTGRISLDLQEAQSGIFDRICNFLFGYKSTELRMVEFRQQNLVPYPHRLIDNIDMYMGVLERPFKEAISRVMKEEGSPIKFSNAFDALEWLKAPADPRDMSFTMRTRIQERLTKEVDQIMEWFNKGVEVEIPAELEGQALTLFKHEAAKYLSNVSEKFESIDDVKEWLGKTPSALGTHEKFPLHPYGRWKKIALQKEFLQKLDLLKRGYQLDLSPEALPFEPQKGERIKETKVHWPEKTTFIGVEREIPSKIVGRAKEVPNANQPKDRVWLTSDHFRSLGEDILNLDKKTQEYAVYKFNQMAKDHFGESYTPTHEPEKIATFLEHLQPNLKDIPFYQSYKKFLDSQWEQQSQMEFAAQTASRGA